MLVNMPSIREYRSTRMSIEVFALPVGMSSLNILFLKREYTTQRQPKVVLFGCFVIGAGEKSKVLIRF
jgi:hypothetical protein